MLSPADLFRLALLALRGSTVLGVVDAWQSLVSVADLWASVRRFGIVAALVTGRAQTRAVALADFHLGSILGTGPSGIDPKAFLGASLSDAPLSLVLASSGAYVRHALGHGVAVPEALDRGLARAVRITSTEVTRAGTEAVATLALASGRSDGWRRVTGPKPCAICAGLADGTVNAWDEAVSAHPHCSCVAAVVIA